MRKSKTLAPLRLAVFMGGAVLALGLFWPLVGTAQDPDANAQHKDTQPTGDQNLTSQLAELRGKVARLETALSQDGKGMPSDTPEQGDKAGTQDKTGGGTPSDRVSAKFQNCLQCHQTRPSGPLPQSHLEEAGDGDKETVQGRTAAGQEEPDPGKGMGMMRGKGMGMMGQGGKGMGGGMGMGMMRRKGMNGGMGMMDMDERKGMGAMGGGEAEMGGMSGGMEGMDMMEMMGVMGMAPKSAGNMAGMKSIGKMQMQATLPGFPGASHIYHVGATDFFLNHPEHITLTSKQKGDLGRLKEKAVLAKTSAQRQIDEAEQELWTLTSADEPDVSKIEAEIQEIEKLRGDQRMTLIRAVGDAAKLLTDEQRQSLLGTGADETAKPDSHTDHKGPQSGMPGKGGKAVMQHKTPAPANQNDTDESADADKDLPGQVRELCAQDRQPGSRPKNKAIAKSGFRGQETQPPELR